MKSNLKNRLTFLFIFLCLTVFLSRMIFAVGQTLDLQTASWDEIVAAAKEEGQVTFYAWYFPDYFKEAAQGFESQYGIKVNLIVGDQTANFNKAIAEKDRAVGTIDIMIVGGQWVKITMDLDLFYGPMKNVIPDAGKLAPSLWEVQEGVLTKGYLTPFHRNQTGILYDPVVSQRCAHAFWSGCSDSGLRLHLVCYSAIARIFWRTCC
jgi:ABC-type uncharacterized transport system YnjBCD substrate-binding protein